MTGTRMTPPPPPPSPEKMGGGGWQMPGQSAPEKRLRAGAPSPPVSSSIQHRIFAGPAAGDWESEMAARAGDCHQTISGAVEILATNSSTSLGLASYYKGYGAVKRDGEKLDQATSGYVKDILKYYEEIKSFQKSHQSEP